MSRRDIEMSSYEGMIKFIPENDHVKWGRNEAEFELHMREKQNIFDNYYLYDVFEKEEGRELNDAEYLLTNGMTKQQAKRLGMDGEIK